MSGGFRIDDDALAGIVHALGSASDGLDGLAGRVPAVPDAGPAVDAVAGILAELVTRSAEVSAGARTAAVTVDSCRADYRAADEAAAPAGAVAP